MTSHAPSLSIGRRLQRGEEGRWGGGVSAIDTNAGDSGRGKMCHNYIIALIGKPLRSPQPYDRRNPTLLKPTHLIPLILRAKKAPRLAIQSGTKI